MTQAETEVRARFKRMEDSTPADWVIIGSKHQLLTRALPDRLLEQLRLLDSESGGFAVDRLTHSLQTAHRAEQDGRDDAYLVCALLHDIGDILAPRNHPDIAAAILKPWVSEAYHWMVEQHGTFQGYYFWHHIGGNRNARDAFEGHEYYDLTEEFVRKYDMPSFDDEYPTPPLEHYEPLLRSFFGS
ncbi:MAG TPA: HD domain-containing protein [Acidimicrobiales bacterium]|nr:HD domain-containing protein [Acidimicrobiales bacterium]